MRKIVLLCTFAFLHVYIFSQSKTDRYSNTNHVEYSNKEKYKVIYELTDESLLGQDSTILKSIDMSVFDTRRDSEEDLEIVDVNTGVSIILYSRKKCLLLESRNANNHLILNPIK